jgi:hypothetical protein
MTAAIAPLPAPFKYGDRVRCRRSGAIETVTIIEWSARGWGAGLVHTSRTCGPTGFSVAHVWRFAVEVELVEDADRRVGRVAGEPITGLLP